MNSRTNKYSNLIEKFHSSFTTRDVLYRYVYSVFYIKCHKTSLFIIRTLECLKN